MNPRLQLSFIILLFASLAVAQDAIRESKSEVTFSGIGKYSVETKSWVTTDAKREDEKTKFKGEGIVKGTLAKLILKSGETGQIILPMKKQIIGLDHKDKKYWITKIAEFDMDSLKMAGEKADAQVEEEMPDTAEREESDIEIIRTRFEVTDHKEREGKNGFDCNHYSVMWMMEWRNKVTGETGTDSLYTDVWNTPYTDEIREVMDVEMAFAQNQLGAMGIDVEAMQRQSMLGLNWIEKMGQINKETSNKPDADSPEWLTELQKLQGYPIVVDGSYFALRPKSNDDTAESSGTSDPTDVKGALGGFMKKKLFGQKKKADGPRPVIAYYTEVKKYETGKAGDKMDIPKNYKLKKD